MMCAIMKTFLKLFEQYIHEILIFFWIILCLDVNYNKGIENGNWLIYLQSLVLFVFIEICCIGNNDNNDLFHQISLWKKYILICHDWVIVPDRFIIRGNIKNRFCEEKCGMDFLVTICVEKDFGWQLSRGGEKFSWYI